MKMIIEIAKKEIRDAFRNKLFMIILVMLLVLTIVSIVLGSYQVKIALDNYNSSIEFLKSFGKTNLPPMPNLNPISASKWICELYRNGWRFARNSAWKYSNLKGA